jgi:hypothetical protein
MDREIERCRREIAAIEAELLGGNPDVAGLCLVLSDWSAELRILEGAVKSNAPTPSSSAAGTRKGPSAGSRLCREGGPGKRSGASSLEVPAVSADARRRPGAE